MSTTPKLSAVIDALVSTFSQGIADADVFDGPLAQFPSAKRFLLVGADELGGNDGVVFQTSTQRSPLANGEFLDESGEVTCSAWAWTGSTTESAWKPTRDAAFELVNECDALLEADPTLGGVLALGHYLELRTQRGLQMQMENGLLVCVRFTVVYSALVTP